MKTKIQIEAEFIANLIAKKEAPPKGYVQSLGSQTENIFIFLWEKKNISVSENWDWLMENGFIIDDII